MSCSLLEAVVCSICLWHVEVPFLLCLAGDVSFPAA